MGKDKPIKKGIIDYAPLNDAIKEVENIIIDFNNEERELILNHIKARIIMERQKNKEGETMQRAMDNLPLGLGKLMKRTAKDFEGD